jgi:TolB protein
LKKVPDKITHDYGAGEPVGIGLVLQELLFHKRESMKTQNILKIVFSSIGIILSLVLAWIAGDALSGATEPAIHYALYVINTDGSEQKILRNDPMFELWGPAWSPDGKHIAISFVASSGDTSEIYLLDADGQNPMQLTHNGHQNYLPAWSHDGSQIAFVSQQGKDTQTAEIYVVDTNGNNERRLTQNDAPEYGVTWSPDDRQIAFGSKLDGNWQIYLMNADGANQHPLTVRADGSAPTWSPDGQSLSLTSERDGSANIYTLTLDGQNQLNVTNDKTVSSNSSWSPDGNKIAFWSERDGMPSIFVMNQNGSKPINLTNTPGLEALNPSWSPDGKQIIFQAAIHQIGISKMFRENLRWIFVATLGLIEFAFVLRCVRRKRKLSKE